VDREHELTPPRRTGPTPQQIRRRRVAALGAVVVALALVVTAVAVALASLHKSAAPPPPPPPRPQRTFRVVFPEGFTRGQMSDRVSAVARIAAAKRGRAVVLSGRQYARASRSGVVPCFGRRRQGNLEGFLFPATYDFLAKTPSKSLVAAQIQAFCENWQTVNLSYARSKNLTPYDVLKIASMVEREAVAPSERPLVAAVIYNRLHARMPLGIDATLRYGLDIPPTQSILESQLQSDNPYNTRKLPGLPPTPIANPGLPSIRAAAHPAKVDYLYFVRKPDRIHHFFTSSEQAFSQYECAHGYGC
jgi:UPF0755 protein